MNVKGIFSRLRAWLALPHALKMQITAINAIMHKNNLLCIYRLKFTYFIYYT